jgi:hypothetical protein
MRSLKTVGHGYRFALRSLQDNYHETGVSVGCASKASKLIKFCLYRVRVMYKLKPADAPQRVQFYNWMLKNVHSGLIDPQLLFNPQSILSLKWLCKFSEHTNLE